ncbi:hypothetical protein P8A22_37995 (plasmid) [Streptomyces laculatispora]|uniref:DUF222 domain-containing protein n=1 Tax=Streptomyces laculatispora TaxID=887464 RepID=A0ABY9IFA9_9ACTN|nr:hypothetical protein [Streptomyces laculatispora]WLQ45623.1 hypothetical protein P8A22_37995 [Streptomyces laculatispora]
MWETMEFGAAHEGRPGVVLADGTEPKPVYFDTGSGANMHESSDWWIYDGTLGAPVATQLRGSCSCGWRGETRYPLDWETVERHSPERHDTCGPENDWDQHITEVADRAVPIPEELTALLAQVDQRLNALAGEAPLAALRAIATLEHTLTQAGRTAALNAEADDTAGNTIGPGLGLPDRDARSRLLRYTLRR